MQARASFEVKLCSEVAAFSVFKEREPPASEEERVGLEKSRLHRS